MNGLKRRKFHCGRRVNSTKHDRFQGGFVRFLEHLEDRLVLSVVGPFDGSRIELPLANATAGQTVPITVNFKTTDNTSPNDRTQDEPLVIAGPGYYYFGTEIARQH